LKLLPNGEVKEIYNGPGKPAWKLALDVKADPNGYHAIRHTKLIKAMQDISSDDKIKERVNE
jgi:hypothetical protein